MSTVTKDKNKAIIPVPVKTSPKRPDKVIDEEPEPVLPYVSEKTFFGDRPFIPVALFALCAVLLVVCLLIFKSIINTGTEAVVQGYKTFYETERESAYQEYYEKYFEKAEQAYHVSNRGTILIGNVQEIGKLEVLRVHDEEFIIQNADKSNGQVTTWLDVQGYGVFTVDLTVAEYIVDNEREHVLVRLPQPEITNVTIDDANLKNLFYDDKDAIQILGIGINDGSDAEGNALWNQLLDEADLRIKKELSSNQHFFLNAQEAAKSCIECLIREFNPDEVDLTVEVEFY